LKNLKQNNKTSVVWQSLWLVPRFLPPLCFPTASAAPRSSPAWSKLRRQKGKGRWNQHISKFVVVSISMEKIKAVLFPIWEIYKHPKRSESQIERNLQISDRLLEMSSRVFCYPLPVPVIKSHPSTAHRHHAPRKSSSAHLWREWFKVWVSSFVTSCQRTRIKMLTSCDFPFSAEKEDRMYQKWCLRSR
jgi:hypothetical protein